MTIEEMNRAMLVYTAMHELQRALLLGGSALREREKELIEAVSVWLDGKRREDTAEETPDRKEGETMTQKEKYKRAASAMRKALVSIMSDGPSTEAATSHRSGTAWRCRCESCRRAQTENIRRCGGRQELPERHGRVL